MNILINTIFIKYFINYLLIEKIQKYKNTYPLYQKI